MQGGIHPRSTAMDMGLAREDYYPKLQGPADPGFRPQHREPPYARYDPRRGLLDRQPNYGQPASPTSIQHFPGPGSPMSPGAWRQYHNHHLHPQNHQYQHHQHHHFLPPPALALPPTPRPKPSVARFVPTDAFLRDETQQRQTQQRQTQQCQLQHKQQKQQQRAASCGHELCSRIRLSNPRHSRRQPGSQAGVLLLSSVRGAPAVMLTRGVLESEIGYGLTAGVRSLEDADRGCYVAAARRILRCDVGIPETTSETAIAFRTFLRLRASASVSGTPVLVGYVSDRDMRELETRFPVAERSATRLFRISRNSTVWKTVGERTERKVSSTIQNLVGQINFNAVGWP